MEKINAYNIDIAIDSYRANNGKENEINIFQDGITRFEYGTKRFSSREQAIEWLKTQTSDHEAIRNYIAKTRENNPNSGLESLFQTYENYYREKQNVISATANQIQSVHPKISTETPSPKPSIDAATIRSELDFNKTIDFLNKSENLFAEFGENNKKLRINFADNYGIKITRADEVFGVIIPTTFEGSNIKKNYPIVDSTDINIIIDGKEITLNREDYKNKVVIPALEKFFGVNISPTKIITESPKITKTPSENTNQNVEWFFEKSGKSATDVQQILLEKGFYKGEITGELDQNTRNAIRNFQAKEWNIINTGKIDQKTFELLFATKSEEAAKTPSETINQNKNSSENPEKSRENPLEKYSKFAEKELAKIGKTILDLQIALTDGKKHSWADGIFGAKTLEAIKEFQTNNNLVADGLVGPKTLEKLFEVSKTTTEKVAKNPTESK